MNEDVANVIMPTALFNNVINILTQLPYKQVFSLLEEIKASVKAESVGKPYSDVLPAQKKSKAKLKAPKQV